MSARKQFSDKSKKSGRLADERLVAREQKDFTKGVFNDLATTPKNGLLYLENAIPMSDGVISRTGTTLFYIPASLNLNNFMTAVKNGTSILVTNTNGHTFSQDDVGRYFRGSDGIWDIIAAVSVVSGTVLTVARSSSYASFSSCALRGEICCMEWVTILAKWIIQIDTRLFLCSWDFSTITQVYFCGNSDQVINESRTKVGYKKGIVILFNSNGMYGIVTDKSLPYYYKMNTLGPQERSPDAAYDISKPYGRRYLCTYSILDSMGQNTDANNNVLQVTRLTANMKIQHESSPNIVQNTAVKDVNGIVVGSALIDYTEMWAARPINESYLNTPSSYLSQTNILQLPAPPDPHWLYHSIWATMDIGVKGIANNNNSERYYYVKDVPVTKAFGPIILDGPSAQVVNQNDGTFSQDDVGSKLYLNTPDNNGKTYYTITEYIDPLNVIIDRGYGVAEMFEDCAGIGCAKMAIATYLNGKVIVSSGSAFKFSEDDVGKIIFWDVGSWDMITEYVDNRTVKISNFGDIHANYQNGAIGWVAADRAYCDGIPDTVLATRAGYLLPHRFFTPMPNCNMGIVVPGFVATAQSNSNMLYYCQTLYSQFIGCFHEGLQYDELDSDIAELSEFPDYLVAYGTHETGWKWALNSAQVISDQTENAVGESISILASRTVLPGKFGVIPGSVAKDENGSDILLSTEKELIVFDGTKFGPNLLSERIMNRVSKLQNAVAARYDTFNGYIFEGTEEVVI
jgi:hypothetical protein